MCIRDRLMASCSSESEYANAIPKDAAMVMSFDFKTMAEKSGKMCIRDRPQSA